MNLFHNYWYFKSAFSSEFCDKIINHSKNQKSKLATTGEYANKKKLNEKEKKDLKKDRNSNVVWLNDQWIYKELHPYINAANKNAGWNFQWDWSESCQFTKYKKGQFYDWHCDSWDKPYNRPNEPNINYKIRKLSVTCSLSDPKEYEGGELQFQLRNKKDPNKILTCSEILPRGSIVVFPSFVWHRVTPVTKGTRYSLVVWNLGYPFR
jgi:PKHD-type hydroxylase